MCVDMAMSWFDPAVCPGQPTVTFVWTIPSSERRGLLDLRTVEHHEVPVGLFEGRVYTTSHLRHAKDSRTTLLVMR